MNYITYVSGSSLSNNLNSHLSRNYILSHIYFNICDKHISPLKSRTHTHIHTHRHMHTHTHTHTYIYIYIYLYMYIYIYIYIYSVYKYIYNVNIYISFYCGLSLFHHMMTSLSSYAIGV